MEKVAIVGGTGPLGRGLGRCFAKAGYPVILGSRNARRASESADELTGSIASSASVTGSSNTTAISRAGIVVLAIPYAGHDEFVSAVAPALTGRVVVSCVNPIGFDNQGPFAMNIGNTSAAETAQALLPGAHVVGAFHHLSAVSLNSACGQLEHEDVMVCGDDDAAKQVVLELAAAVTGHPGIDVGPLRLARQLEPLTAVLISINRRYGARSGVKVAGFNANAVPSA